MAALSSREAKAGVRGSISPGQGCGDEVTTKADKMKVRLFFLRKLCYNESINGHVEVHMLDERMNRKQIEEMAEAMLTLRDREEALLFFEDIFTIKELQAVAQRLAVARLLKKKVTYQDIAEQTGASTATISRVNRSLTYGAGGYQMVLSRMKEASSQEE